MQILSVIWNVTPEFIRFTDSYAIRWYGILFSLSYILGYIILHKTFSKEQIPSIVLEKLTLATLLGGVIGARLGHCLFYEPTRYMYNPIRILFVWEGGLASHGGALGILIGLYIISRKLEYSLVFILSRLLLVVPLAAALIRIGNLINSEIYGMPTNVPWGFVFNQSIDVQAGVEQAVPRHPTQIYEALLYLIIFIYLQVYYWRKIQVRGRISEWYILGVFFVGIFVSRFVVEFFKVNQVPFENGMWLNMGQILSIPFILFGIFCLYKKSIADKKSENVYHTQE